MRLDALAGRDLRITKIGGTLPNKWSAMSLLTYLYVIAGVYSLYIAQWSALTRLLVETFAVPMSMVAFPTHGLYQDRQVQLTAT